MTKMSRENGDENRSSSEKQVDSSVNRSRRSFLTILGVALAGLSVGYILGYLVKPVKVIKETVTHIVSTTATQTVEYTKPAETIRETVTQAIPTTVTQTVERTKTVTTTETVTSTATTSLIPRMGGKVAIVRSTNSYEGTLKALELIDSEAIGVVKGRRKFLIKPNFVSAYTYLSATPLETVKAVLDYIYSRFNVSEIIIAETPAVGSFYDAIKNYGYTTLKESYGVEFLNLDEYEQESLTLKDESGNSFEVYVSKILLDKSFVKISPCRAKTHDTVVVTLSIKNIVMGGIRSGYRRSMHRSYLTINYNIAKLATLLMPDIGIVDGVQAMEGNGPISGTLKRWGVVFASTNPVNLDSVVAYAMGFNPNDVGYLYFLSSWGYGETDISRIETIGEDLESIKTKFKPHSTYNQQLSWKQKLDKVHLLE